MKKHNRDVRPKLTKEEALESIKIIEKNIEDVRTGRSSEFDIDELEEELEFHQECLDYWLEEEKSGRLNPIDEEER